MPGTTAKVLENLVNYTAIKQKVISKNIANITTVNYQREDVAFKSVLENTSGSDLKATHPRHMGTNQAGNPSDQQFQIVKDKNTEMVSGVNNVDIDREMAEMAENAIQYKFAARRLGDHYRSIQNAIKGGSR
ncbi:MAG: flagellar basal body rod protein FlgB [Chlorobiaceae bacterium]|nr:flagellar basal body rod protein FlgB [Chlorobiaceae bacterium]